MLRKIFLFSMLGIILSFILFSCKGDPGPAGDKGDTGNTGKSLIVMQFQNGVLPSDAYTGTVDTYIVKDASTNNYGACNIIGITNEDCGQKSKRGLIKFDVSSIVPLNLIVEKAYLELYMTAATNPPVSFAIHELNKNFEQGNSCNATGYASWISATASTMWTTPGGDYNEESIANFIIPASPSSNKITVELNPVVVQKWINDPTENKGILIKTFPDTYGACKGATFISSEHSELLKRPKLTIYYSLP